MQLYMFRTVPLSIIGSLFTVHSAMVYVIQLSTNLYDIYHCLSEKLKVKVIPQGAEVAQGCPGSLMPRIILTFGTTRVVDCQPYAPTAFTPG